MIAAMGVVHYAVNNSELMAEEYQRCDHKETGNYIKKKNSKYRDNQISALSFLQVQSS